jgi:hypothetical protein
MHPFRTVLHVGDRVSFRIPDVYLPSVREVMEDLTERVELVGTVIEFSDSGTKSGVFAVIEIGADQRVIVPVDRVSFVAGGPSPLG